MAREQPGVGAALRADAVRRNFIDAVETLTTGVKALRTEVNDGIATASETAQAQASRQEETIAAIDALRAKVCQ